MEALTLRLKTLADRVDAMSVRERGLIFFGVMVVLYLIAYNVVFGPLRAEQLRLEQDIKTKRDQSQAADQQVSALFSQDGKNPASQNRAKVAALTQQIAELDTHMDQMTAGVVTPKEMAKLIEQMLSRNKNLELVKLEALPSTALDPEMKTATAAPTPPGGGVMVYRHGMRVELRGRYFDIVDYLKTLEGLPWKVFWGQVSLESDKYPVSKVTLVIYTLSRYPAWIGV
jgi:MSHA biogenesis protein MshJ